MQNNISFDDMEYILNNMREIIFDDEADEIIKKFKKIGSIKRSKAKLKIDDKKYNNIHIFDEKDSPVMIFAHKKKKTNK